MVENTKNTVTEFAARRVAVNKARAEKAVGFARKGALAYAGLYVAAYEYAKPALAKTNTIFDEMVVKGEAIEATAQTRLQGVTKLATTKAADAASRVRSALPSLPANDRVTELEDEVEALNKKIAALTKKKAAAAKSAAKVKTQKTAKPVLETKAA